MAKEQTQTTVKPLLENLLGEGNLNLNINATVKASIDNQSILKLFAMFLLVGVLLFAVWYMFSYLFQEK